MEHVYSIQFIQIYIIVVLTLRYCIVYSFDFILIFFIVNNTRILFITKRIIAPNFCTGNKLNVYSTKNALWESFDGQFFIQNRNKFTHQGESKDNLIVKSIKHLTFLKSCAKSMPLKIVTNGRKFEITHVLCLTSHSNQRVNWFLSKLNDLRKVLERCSFIFFYYISFIITFLRAATLLGKTEIILLDSTFLAHSSRKLISYF